MGSARFYESKNSSSDLGFEAKIWFAAYRLRSTFSSAEGTQGGQFYLPQSVVRLLVEIGIPMAMNRSCYGVRGVNHFIYFALHQAAADLYQRTDGTVFDTITYQTFETLECTFPPANLAQAFDRAAAPMVAQVPTNLYQTRILVTLRGPLLPKLRNGELKVSG